MYVATPLWPKLKTVSVKVVDKTDDETDVTWTTTGVTEIDVAGDYSSYEYDVTVESKHEYRVYFKTSDDPPYLAAVTLSKSDTYIRSGFGDTDVTGSVDVEDFIDKILRDMAQPTDGTGFYSRSDVFYAVDYIQKEISRLTENIFATTATLEPATSATSITIDSNGNFIRGYSVYRTYGGFTKQIPFVTENQCALYDGQWRTRTGSEIRGLITDITNVGYARPYPIPDNGDNDIIVNYIKLATALDEDGTIEIPKADQPCLEYGTKALLYSFEKDGKDESKANFWKGLYGGKDPKTGILTGELANVRARVRQQRGSTYSVLSDRAESEILFGITDYVISS